MSFSKQFKRGLKKTINRGVNKFLSQEVQQELGIQKIPAQDLSVDPNDLSSFWTPVQSNMISNKKKERFSNIVITLIVVMGILLIGALLMLISPNTKSYNPNGETVVVINGENASEIAEDKQIDQMTSEDLNIENIKVKPDSANDIVANSPMLQSDTTIMEYKVQNGDTIEKIATRFYGHYNYQLIQKIKVANNIANPRSLQIGQKLIIPLGS